MKSIYSLSLAILITCIFIYGCSKKLESSLNKPSLKTSIAQNKLVATPGGMMPASNMHYIPKGFHLALKGGHVQRINSLTGEVAEDFGEFHPGIAGFSTATNLPATASHPVISKVAPSLSVPQSLNVSNPAWLAWLGWQDTSGTNPINYFSTTWTVPDYPVATDSPILFIFNQLADGSGIGHYIVSTMQWGFLPEPVEGAPLAPQGDQNVWCISNWFFWMASNGLSGAFSDVLPVRTGQNVQAVIQMLGQNADGTYNYSSSFTGYDNAMIVVEGDTIASTPAPGVPGLVTAFTTLEAYTNRGGKLLPSIYSPSDLPAGVSTLAMKDISLSLTNGYPYYYYSPGAPILPYKVYGVHWTPGQNVQANFDNYIRVSALVVDSSVEGQGQVNLYFQRPQINLGEQPLPLNSTYPKDTCYIEAMPGSTVTVQLTITGGGTSQSGIGTGTCTILSPGVTFSGGGTSISATNEGVSQKVVKQTLTIPASGIVAAVATYTGGTMAQGSLTVF